MTYVRFHFKAAAQLPTVLSNVFGGGREVHLESLEIPTEGDFIETVLPASDNKPGRAFLINKSIIAGIEIREEE